VLQNSPLRQAANRWNKKNKKSAVIEE